VYVAGKDRKSSTVVLDESEGPWFDGIYEGRDEHVPPLFSPDSAHLAYAVVLRNGPKSQIGAVRDGKVLGAYGDVDPATFRFSTDSAHLAWVARNQDVQCVIIDGQETEKQFPTLLNNRALVFDSSNHLHAFIGSEGRGELARLDVDIAPATSR
jgi:hypothetical protein